MAQRPQVRAQIADTYRRMATEARHRPAIATEEMDDVTARRDQLDLDQEAKTYARQWGQEEAGREFHVGVCQDPTRPATIFAIEAARNMCAGDDELALELLQMAVLELEAQL
jgi:hypothetical protein